jgi:hypothetical protein
MRGNEKQQEEMFACGGLGERVPADHPLRRIRVMTDAALAELKPELEAMYAGTGRPSIPPEQMLRALLLQMLTPSRTSQTGLELHLRRRRLQPRPHQQTAARNLSPPPTRLPLHPSPIHPNLHTTSSSSPDQQKKYPFSAPSEDPRQPSLGQRPRSQTA